MKNNNNIIIVLTNSRIELVSKFNILIKKVKGTNIIFTKASLRGMHPKSFYIVKRVERVKADAIHDPNFGGSQ